MTTRNALLCALCAGWLAGQSARALADEDDDDPKSTPRPTVKLVKPEPAKPDPKPAAARPEPKPAAAKPEPKPAAAKPEPKPAAARPEPKPAKAAKADPKPAAVEPKVATVEPKSAVELKPMADCKPTSPFLEAPPGMRTVRVRLLDGSQVIGLVRAEEADVLIIDCALGQLSIPRPRISTIAYDAAAAISSKRAPVQQLDDDLPRKK